MNNRRRIIDEGQRTKENRRRVLSGLLCLVFCTLCSLTSCHTQKKIAQTKPHITAEQQLAQKVIEAQPMFQTAEASKVRVRMMYGGQKVSMNGSISVITDSLMVLSVQPLLGIEMFRIEMTQAQIVVIDKMNRKYVRLTYTELSDMIGLPLTYSDLQAVFLNRMFVIGKEQAAFGQLPFTSTTTSQEHRLLLQEKALSYTFGIAPQTYALTSTEVALGNATATVKYAGHQMQDGVFFPITLFFTINDGKDNTTECELSLLKVQFNKEMKITRANLNRYSQTTLNKILFK